MLTINAMVRIGPWTIESVSYNSSWQTCERTGCGKNIKEVWTCVVDASYGKLDVLGGKTSWQIGSVCGPTLIEVSEQIWSKETKMPSKRLKLLKRLEVLTDAAEKQSYELPNLFKDYRPMLIDGTISAKQIGRMGFILTANERRVNETVSGTN
jgi:hypothetical protein